MCIVPLLPTQCNRENLLEINPITDSPCGDGDAEKENRTIIPTRQIGPLLWKCFSFQRRLRRSEARAA